MVALETLKADHWINISKGVAAHINNVRLLAPLDAATALVVIESNEDWLASTMRHVITEVCRTPRVHVLCLDRRKRTHSQMDGNTEWFPGSRTTAANKTMACDLFGVILNEGRIRFHQHFYASAYNLNAGGASAAPAGTQQRLLTPERQYMIQKLIGQTMHIAKHYSFKSRPGEPIKVKTFKISGKHASSSDDVIMGIIIMIIAYLKLVTVEEYVELRNRYRIGLE